MVATARQAKECGRDNNRCASSGLTCRRSVPHVTYRVVATSLCCGTPHAQRLRRGGLPRTATHATQRRAPCVGSRVSSAAAAAATVPTARTLPLVRLRGRDRIPLPTEHAKALPRGGDKVAATAAPLTSLGQLVDALAATAGCRHQGGLHLELKRTPSPVHGASLRAEH